MSPKSKIIEEAGKSCAEHLERALPTIKKIAQDAKEIDSIYIKPVLKNYESKNKPVSGAFMITVVKEYLPTLTRTVSEEDFVNQKNKSTSLDQRLIKEIDLVVNAFINHHNLREEQKSNFSFLDWFKQLFK